MPPDSCADRDTPRRSRPAMDVRAGRKVQATAAVACAECGVARWQHSGEIWLHDWNGQPVCKQCLDDLEWFGELSALRQEWLSGMDTKPPQ